MGAGHTRMNNNGVILWGHLIVMDTEDFTKYQKRLLVMRSII